MVDYDTVIVGGGLGGASLARLLASNGKRVLVAERERQFKDRIRGEWLAPWGVAEAQRIGIYELLRQKCAHETPYHSILGAPTRDLRSTTVQRLPSFTFYHPAMQEAVLDGAREVGAEVLRGVSVSKVDPSDVPIVTFEGARPGKLGARIVVCADGRSSMGRVWGGFSAKRGRQRYMGAGILFDNVPIPDDTSIVALNPLLGRFALLFPQGEARVRAYLMFPPDSFPRLQGSDDVTRFVDESAATGLDRKCFADARPAGPLATFDMTEAWVEHPYRDGVALIGDAAGATDPTWGQGLSMTMRDVRVLGENLLADDDWNAAGRAYARERTSYFDTMLTVEDWQFEVFLDQSPAARKVRERALPLILREPDRLPDHSFSGPDLPRDENVRRRFFGED